VDVSVDGTDSASAVIQLLNISNTVPLTPTLGMALPTESVLHGSSGTDDYMFEFRTGFKVEAHVPFSPSAANSVMSLNLVGQLPVGMTSAVEDVAGSTSKVLKLVWDKPCWHQNMARHVLVCFLVTETSTAAGTPAVSPYAATDYVRRSNPACVNMLILEDTAPKFIEPAPESVFAWEMGRTSSFTIRVHDDAVLDTVAKLEVSPSTPLATAMVLSPVVVSGNSAHRQLTWEPLPSSGGGQYKLCFDTEDTPGITYERCRLGARAASLCVTVVVQRCRYVVRARESLNDVAAHFHTDWIQLWALNPELRRPDEQVGYREDSSALGAAIKTGHLYKADSGDYLAAVAYKFGTSVKMLLHLNADLVGAGQEDELEVGKRLCIIPNSCLRD